MDNKMSRIKGAIFGHCVGDAMGITEMMMPCEIKKKYGKVTEMIGGGWLKLKPGEITDDGAMMISVAQSLVSTGGVPDYKDMADRLLIWLDSNPKDVGLACRRGLEAYRKTGSLRNGDEDTLGNGGLLRVLGFALAGREWGEAMKHAELTHNSSHQYRAVQSYMNAIQAGLIGGSKEDMMRDVKGIRIRCAGVTNNKGDVHNTLSSALNWFNTTNSFEECIISAINAGGDADSVAAIAGGLAGCHYGITAIPERWMNTLDRGVYDELAQLTKNLVDLSSGY